ncbi:hypothetical protein [Micromonospora sp. URMC 103]|uniref:hypothetical protein n=1 Tax=Micromonospora sp. URMC 103 TaxID=3423406 RepID=UPI003F1D1D97
MFVVALVVSTRHGYLMQRWDRLNGRQMDFLRRIADGDDLSTPEGVAHRTSARALQTRRLLHITRMDGTWRATVTEAGRFYLQHGFHPEDPAHVANPPTTRPKSEPASVPGQRSAAASTGGTASATIALAQQLLDQLAQGDGVVRIEEPDEQTRARYRRAIHAAKQHKLIPDGHELRRQLVTAGTAWSSTPRARGPHCRCGWRSPSAR